MHGIAFGGIIIFEARMYTVMPRRCQCSLLAAGRRVANDRGGSVVSCPLHAAPAK